MKYSNQILCTSPASDWPTARPSSRWLADITLGWSGRRVRVSSSGTGWTSSTCWPCCPTTWSSAWPASTPRTPGTSASPGSGCWVSETTTSPSGQKQQTLQINNRGTARRVQWTHLVSSLVFCSRPLSWWMRRRTTCKACCKCSGCSSSLGSSSWPGNADTVWSNVNLIENVEMSI